MEPSWAAFASAICCLVGVLHASDGDADPLYRRCVDECEHSGCVGNTCFNHCRFSSIVSSEGPWYMQEPLYLQWKQWDCKIDCAYHCMLKRENEREKLGRRPVKYHGKWPFKRIFGIQEPVSVAFSALNLAVQFHGWLSFFVLMYYKLPLRPDIALLGGSLIVAILLAFNIRDEATRVMVSAPFIAFIATHILYLNLYKLDYGLNMKVCVIMSLAQLFILAIWARMTRHPSSFKLWVIVAGTLATMLLEIYDFPLFKGYVDAHALWHAATIPLSYLWWSFVRDDAEFRTSVLIEKVK